VFVISLLPYKSRPGKLFFFLLFRYKVDIYDKFLILKNIDNQLFVFI